MCSFSVSLFLQRKSGVGGGGGGEGGGIGGGAGAEPEKKKISPICKLSFLTFRRFEFYVKAKLFVWLVGFLTSSSTTRLYRERVPRQSPNFTCCHT